MNSVCMKVFGICLFAFAQFGSQAFACALDEPIDLPESNLHELAYPFSISKAKFDKEPMFDDASAYDPETDGLTLDIFNLNWENRDLKIMGTAIYQVKSSTDWPERIGFSPSYGGTFPNFEKGYRNENGLETFTTRYNLTLVGERHRGDLAEYLMIAKIKNQKLLSFELKLPIFEVYSRANHTVLLAFTGEHQTLCLKSGVFQ